MSYVTVAPEIMTAAAADLATIADTLSVAHTTVAAPTVAVPNAAADEVSTGIAQLFSGFGQEYQAAAQQVAAYQEQFVKVLALSSRTYANLERFLALWLRYAIVQEQSAFNLVVQNPASLLTPEPYLYASSPPLFPIVFPFALLLAASGFPQNPGLFT